MADINPLTLIGKSNIAPDEPGRKAAADLQRGLAQIELQNRGRLDNTRLTNQGTANAAAIKGGFTGTNDPNFQTGSDKNRLAALDLSSAQTNLAGSEAALNRGRLGFGPKVGANATGVMINDPNTPVRSIVPLATAAARASVPEVKTKEGAKSTYKSYVFINGKLTEVIKERFAERGGKTKGRSIDAKQAQAIYASVTRALKAAGRSAAKLEFVSQDQKTVTLLVDGKEETFQKTARVQ